MPKYTEPKRVVSETTDRYCFSLVIISIQKIKDIDTFLPRTMTIKELLQSGQENFGLKHEA